ncbi:uncharacterized protein [Epargyreus clarus]|uniref:uncharacterized protein n=1 Tax=Epargyreus clarus TaxID=520877 RepID=UPI003C2B2F15
MTKSKRRSLRSRLLEELYTCCAFWIALSALPALALSYVVVRVSKHLWLKLLTSRYPRLEFIRTDTVRSLLDTHRNQGIINVLLAIKGNLNAEDIKQELIRHVIDRRDKNGDLMFPRLRHCLVSVWGNYAWDRNVAFRPENHFLVANAVYRGRPVTDANIQDYVSEIISKYFPSENPPWQYIVIPCVSPEPKYYILVRVHHLLLSGNKSINIGDLLLISQSPQTQMTTQHTEYTLQSPLGKLLPAPSAIPELWSKLNESLSNVWNEFISEYDPMESPRALKTRPGAFHVAGLVLMSTASALRELTKKRSTDRDQQPIVTATELLMAVQRECKRRNLTVAKILMSPLVTLDPRKWPRTILGTAMTTTRTIVTFPYKVWDELLALNELRATGHVRRSHTMTWKYGEIAQLWARASAEAWRGVVQAYRAPSRLWTDTVGADDGKRHLLQSVSLCGRKVTSWSHPVSRESMERAARALGVSCTDIALYAATEALRAFFEQTQSTTPDNILVTARAATEDFLYTFAEGNGKNYKKSQTGGMICLSLPVGASPRRISSVVEEACSRQSAIAGAWAAQARYGALTRCVPSPLARLTLNLLSRRYAVSYAEINAPADSLSRTTLWGQTVDYVVYWRPPQANISMSLTVVEYGGAVRLCVMADARLAPAHAAPAARWPPAAQQLIARIDQQLARIAQLPRPPNISNVVQAANIPAIIQPDHPEQDLPNEPELDDPQPSASTETLRPPSPTVVSPPPMRRRIAHN